MPQVLPLRARVLPWWLVVAGACACAMLLAPAPLRADPAIEGPAQRLFQRIMSPYCPGLQLAACPSPQADELRNEIRAALTAGRSSDEIEADLHRRFGNTTRAEPAFAGLGRIVWIVPILLFLAGGAVLALWLRRCRQPSDAPSAHPSAGPLAESLATPLDEPRRAGDAAGRRTVSAHAADPSRAAALRQRLDDELDAM